jgi:hypothetical protein
VFPDPFSFRRWLSSADSNVRDTLSVGTVEFGIGTSIAHAQNANQIVDHSMDLLPVLPVRWVVRAVYIPHAQLQKAWESGDLHGPRVERGRSRLWRCRDKAPLARYVPVPQDRPHVNTRLSPRRTN